MPPPPENFPEGWENEWQPSFENAQIAERRRLPIPPPRSALAVLQISHPQQPEDNRPTPVSETPEVQAVIRLPRRMRRWRKRTGMLTTPRSRSRSAWSLPATVSWTSGASGPFMGR